MVWLPACRLPGKVPSQQYESLGYIVLPARAFGFDPGLRQNPIWLNGVLFDGIEEKFKCLQWHSAEVSKIPEGAKILASSEDCLIQAIKWETRAYSVQFHLEAEAETVKNWSQIPAYSQSLIMEKGKSGVKRLEDACKVQMENFNKNAERVYLNWLQASARI